MKSAIVYSSKYGTTAKYAKDLSQRLNALALNIEYLNALQLVPFDIVIWGLPIYSGRLKGIQFAKKMIEEFPDRQHYVFIVGMTPTSEEEHYRKATRDNFPPDLARHVKRFYFVCGDVYQAKLSLIDRGRIKMVAESLRKNAQEDLPVEMLSLLSPGASSNNYDPGQLADLLEDVQMEVRAIQGI